MGKRRIIKKGEMSGIKPPTELTRQDIKKLLAKEAILFKKTFPDRKRVNKRKKQ